MRQITGYMEDYWETRGLDIPVPSASQLGERFASNWLRVSQGCQICLKSFVGMTFADFRRDPLEFPIFGGR
ncbi:hypothetical protein AU476_40260 [Cupriavidus sp. UYMSc13B]|nr:hypothetical protein AU476_15270 [Cupriavidus sp. UYMSc13B]RWA57655.1 hypothetical protein AU476_40260 [Cupriavidus sp. UYMSc13B]